jgi:hypothetical protein
MFTPSHAVAASSTVIPATKRDASRRPVRDRSAHPRTALFPERAINKDRSKATASSTHPAIYQFVGKMHYVTEPAQT